MGFKHSFIIIFLILFNSLNAQQKETTILIGIDGFRWDIVDRIDINAPNLKLLISDGTRGKMIPRVPTLSFPNLYTLVTGLNPENSGIMSNETYLPEKNEFFNKKSFTESVWWKGEPIWVTAEKQEIKSATMFWVASEAEINGYKPSYYHKFDLQKWYPEKRSIQVLEWLDLKENKPNFITLYFDEVDVASQDFGIGSKQEKESIEVVDKAIGTLIKGLKERKIYDKTNIVVVADHGMTETSQDRVIFIDDYINLDSVDIFAFKNHPYFSFTEANFKSKEDSKMIYNKLVNATTNWDIYLKENTPERFHRKNTDRIGDFIIYPKNGWTVSTHDLFEKSLRGEPFKNKDFSYRGGFMKAMHGYDNVNIDMRAIFIAKGSGIKKGHITNDFDNIHIYSLLCKLLNIKPAKNDGNIEALKDIFK